MEQLIIEGSLQSDIYNFLKEARPHQITVPAFLKKDSKSNGLIVIGWILPMMQEVETNNPQKKMVADWLEQMLLDSETVSNIHRCFSDSKFELVNSSKLSWADMLMKMVTIPTKYINIIGQLGGSRKVDITTIGQYTQTLYNNVLEYGINLPQEQKMLLINKMIVLGHCSILVDYLLDHKRQDFLLESISSLSKKNKIIHYLYTLYITSIKNGKQSTRIKHLLQQLANSQPSHLTDSFVSLLTNNQTDLFQGKTYKHYYQLIYSTKIKEDIFKQLLKWWAISRNYIITATHAQIKTNILCLFIEASTKQELACSEYTPSIIEGVKKRLTDGSSKVYAMLVWKILAEVMDLPATEEVKKAEYFVIKPQVIVNHQVQAEQGQQKTQKMKFVIEQKPKEEQKTKPMIQQIQEEEDGVIKIVPKNIYDCILGLRNEQRAATVLQKLPTLIQTHKEDLTLMWNSLLETLLTPLKEQYRAVLVLLFRLRPEYFIESLSVHFMAKEKSVGEKMELIQMLEEGIEELASIKPEQEVEDQGQFYFKKVKSTYYREDKSNNSEKQQKQKEKERDGRTRRWGHTRIDHQQKTKGVSLKIINESHINRFNPISSLLYFKIIDLFTLDLLNHLRKHQIFVQQLLKLIATFTTHIKHNFDKNMLLSDISNVCLRIIEELVLAKDKGSNQYEESGGQTLMLCLQVLNKIGLVIDKYASQMVLTNLKACVDGVRKLPNYGLNAVVDMIQGSILKNVYTGTLLLQHM